MSALTFAAAAGASLAMTLCFGGFFRRKVRKFPTVLLCVFSVGLHFSTPMTMRLLLDFSNSSVYPGIVGLSTSGGKVPEILFSYVSRGDKHKRRTARLAS